MKMGVPFGRLFGLIWLAMAGGTAARAISGVDDVGGGPVVEQVIQSGEALSMAGGGSLPDDSSLLSKYWWMALLLLPFLFFPW